MNEESHSEDKNSEKTNDDVQIISNNDERLKCIGKVLNSDSSREILQLITQKEMTALEISEQTKQSLSLVIHHLNNMMQGGIVTITKTEPNTKNQLMKYYSAKSGIVILPENAAKKAKNSKSLSNSLKSVIKFGAVGFATIFSWFATSSEYNKDSDSTVVLDRKIYQVNVTGIETTEYLEPVIIDLTTLIPIVILAVGIFVIWYSKK